MFLGAAHPGKTFPVPEVQSLDTVTLLVTPLMTKTGRGVRIYYANKADQDVMKAILHADQQSPLDTLPGNSENHGHGVPSIFIPPHDQFTSFRTVAEANIG